MKTLYFDCSMGAAGDMLMAALLELLPDRQAFINEMNCLNLPGVRLRSEPAVKGGIAGTQVLVTVQGQTEKQTECLPEASSTAHSLPELEDLIQRLPLPETVRHNACQVYRELAAAESLVHRQPVSQVHFHEVGSLDAVCDIVGVCRLIDQLQPDLILASPVHVGSGQVRCAHGLLPVPAPATAELLKGIPIYGGAIVGELCTPTGAALLKHFVAEFGPLPILKVERIGYGMGQKDFPAPNCVRALLGDSDCAKTASVCELTCNLDDMTGEALGFAIEQLFSGGALDVWTVPLTMKKNRPGWKLSCLCTDAQRDQLIRLLFLHTTTLGIREATWQRHTLDRCEITRATDWGPVRIKQATGWGVQREKVEYEDLARIARQKQCSLAEAQALIDPKKDRPV